MEKGDSGLGAAIGAGRAIALGGASWLGIGLLLWIASRLALA